MKVEIKHYKTKDKQDLVSDLEHDAFYFRKLESQGIYLNEYLIEAVRNTAKTLLASCAAGSGKSLSIIANTNWLVLYNTCYILHIAQDTGIWIAAVLREPQHNYIQYMSCRKKRVW